jgi:hypothetical protein
VSPSVDPSSAMQRRGSDLLPTGVPTRKAPRWRLSAPWSPPGRSCSRRWMVAASWPASSASRLAARPAGAASTIVTPLAGPARHRADGEGPAAVGAAGQDRDLGGQGGAGGVGLSGGEVGAGLRAGGAGCAPGTVRPDRTGKVDGGDLRCCLGLRVPGRRGYLFADHSLGGGELVQAGGDQVGGDVEDLAASAISAARLTGRPGRGRRVRAAAARVVPW